MNMAALLSFLHPMIVMVICGIWVLAILKTDYSEVAKGGGGNVEAKGEK
jgi:hypothetical protein